MGYRGFTRLQQHDVEGGAVYNLRRRQHLFTRTELALLIPLTTLATGVGVFTVVYTVHQRNTIEPAVLAALGGISLLLIVVVLVVFRWLRRPTWCGQVDSGPVRRVWQASPNLPVTRAVPVHHPEVVAAPVMTEPGELCAAVPIAVPPSPKPSTFTSRVRLAIEKAACANLLSRRSFDSDTSFVAHEDQDVLLPSDSGRSSVESSDGGRGQGLWQSVSELPGVAKHEKLRKQNLKRLSRESRRSRRDMGEDASNFQMVVTKPEPTASRRSSALPPHDVSLRETSLVFDPLRANPVQLRRDPSMRQTRSSHDLPGLCRISASPSLRRPRSAEPAPNRCGLGLEAPRLPIRPEAPAVGRVKAVSPSRHEKERHPGPSKTPAVVRPTPVSPMTPEHELKDYPILRGDSASVRVSPVSPLSFAERMAQKQRSGRRGAPGSDGQGLRMMHTNRM